MERRKRILRQYGIGGYPCKVCRPCGEEAARASDTKVQDIIITTLGECGVCHQHTMVTTCWDFGYPTFYTYESGEPVARR